MEKSLEMLAHDTVGLCDQGRTQDAGFWERDTSVWAVSDEDKGEQSVTVLREPEQSEMKHLHVAKM